MKTLHLSNAGFLPDVAPRVAGRAGPRTQGLPAAAQGTVLSLCCRHGIGIHAALCLTENTVTFWSSFIVSPKLTDRLAMEFFLFFWPQRTRQILTPVMAFWKWTQSSSIASTINICITHGAALRLGRTRGCLVSLLTLERRELRCQINRATCPVSHGQGS